MVNKYSVLLIIIGSILLVQCNSQSNYSKQSSAKKEKITISKFINDSLLRNSDTIVYHVCKNKIRSNNTYTKDSTTWLQDLKEIQHFYEADTFSYHVLTLNEKPSVFIHKCYINQQLLDTVNLNEIGKREEELKGYFKLIYPHNPQFKLAHLGDNTFFIFDGMERGVTGHHAFQSNTIVVVDNQHKSIYAIKGQYTKYFSLVINDYDGDELLNILQLEFVSWEDRENFITKISMYEIEGGVLKKDNQYPFNGQFLIEDKKDGIRMSSSY